MKTKQSLFVKDGIDYTAPFAAISGLFLTWGVAHGLLDTLDKNFQEMLHLKKWQSSFIQFSLYSAYFCMAFPAGMFNKKFGYKSGLLFGLILFACGALAAAATAPVQSFVLFLICLLIIGAGLATIETAANPYTTKLGPPETAERRINIAQSFNGLAWLIGPLIALYIYRNRSHVEGEKMASIVLPFLLIGIAVLVIAFIIWRLKLPVINEQDETFSHGHVEAATTTTTFNENTSIWSKSHFKLGFIAQACYVAGQTGIFSYLINFVTDKDMHPRFDIANAPYFLSIGFALFTIGRFSGSSLMKIFEPGKLLAFYALMVCILLPVVAMELGWVSLISLYAVFFFMSIMFPTIFALAIRGLGTQTKRASSFLVMAVGGGAVFPPIMGLVADHYGMAIGFLTPIPLFAFVLYYASRYNKMVS